MSWRAQADIDAWRGLPVADRRKQLEAALSKAMQRLASEQGVDRNAWRWGRLHTSLFKHPLVSAFDLPAVERDGGAETVNATGAVYRLITDFSDPDKSLVTIGPGISGQPGSPFYGNLLDDWVEGRFFPLAYTRAAVESVTAHRLRLQPLP
jgi:penicillin amidase